MLNLEKRVLAWAWAWRLSERLSGAARWKGCPEDAMETSPCLRRTKVIGFPTCNRKRVDTSDTEGWAYGQLELMLLQS